MRRPDETSEGKLGSAFDARLTPHVPAMHRASLKILGSEDLAWDAVQETLLRVWAHGTLPEDPRGVLLHLVRRSCLHILRCARRRADHERHAGEGHSACCSLDPAEEVGVQEELDQLLRLSRRLTEEHRQVLELVGWRGLSYREAAIDLAVPIGTIRSRAARARAELRRLTEESDAKAEVSRAC